MLPDPHKKAKWLSEKALQIAVNRREAKSKGENEKHTHLNAEFSMQNAGLDEAQAGIKIARRNINNLRYADDTTLMYGRKQRGSKEPLDESERGE